MKFDPVQGEFLGKQMFLLFLGGQKESLCYQIQQIIFRLITVNKHFRSSIWLVVRSWKLLASMKQFRWIMIKPLPKVFALPELLPEHRQKRRFDAQLICEGKQRRVWFAISEHSFSHSRGKFQSKLGIFVSVFSPLFRKTNSLSSETGTVFCAQADNGNTYINTAEM